MIEQSLRNCLADMGSAVIAFSGGVDSAVVLAAAARSLGDRVLAVTGSSASIAEGELDGAVAVARTLGVKHEIIQTREFDDPRYRSNSGARCYYCKEELYTRLTTLACERGFGWVADGCNADDGRAPLDRRPGRAAGMRFRVRSPLEEVGAGKDAVRAIAVEYGLQVWNKPATPCLSSRVPHGTRIEVDDLRRVDLAERYLRACGFEVVRVRHFGSTARIEVLPADVEKLRTMSRRVARALVTVGYSNIEIDQRGYRTGSLNELS
jgi:uncharacterized protein